MSKDSNQSQVIIEDVSLLYNDVVEAFTNFEGVVREQGCRFIPLPLRKRILFGKLIQIPKLNDDGKGFKERPLTDYFKYKDCFSISYDRFKLLEKTVGEAVFKGYTIHLTLSDLRFIIAWRDSPNSRNTKYDSAWY